MDIHQFVKEFKGFPVLFVGTGLSKRYLVNSYSWEELLKKISFDIFDNKDAYIDIKDESRDKDGYHSFPKIASLLEKHIQKICSKGQYGKDTIWERINKQFYEYQSKGTQVNRIQLYISELLKTVEYNLQMKEELEAFKLIKNKVGSVVTTNYDNLIEDCFGFNPLVGNDILLSNPYGSVYKIHGSVDKPEGIIITSEGYKRFNEKYELIKARILAFFIENPIIFIGYSVTDENIRKMLKTVFLGLPSKEADNISIRDNFLLIVHKAGADSTEVINHDIDIDGQIIRIKKVETDNFKEIYQALYQCHYSISVMDVRKVQNIVMDLIHTPGEKIKVHIEEDIDLLENSEKVIAVGSNQNIKIKVLNKKEMIYEYFDIIEKNNSGVLMTIDVQGIQKREYFPARGFTSIIKSFSKAEEWRCYQDAKIEALKAKQYDCCSSIKEIVKKYKSPTRCLENIVGNVLSGNINIDDFKVYILEYRKSVDLNCDSQFSNYRKLICVYDYICYKNIKYK